MKLLPQTLAAHMARKFPKYHQPEPITARLDALYAPSTLAPDPHQPELDLRPCCADCERREQARQSNVNGREEV